MTDATASPNALPAPTRRLNDAALLKKRYAAERRFQMYGIAAILFALVFLIVLFSSIIGQGWSAFVQTGYNLDVAIEKEVVAPEGKTDPDSLRLGDYTKLARNSLAKALGYEYAKMSRPDRRDLNNLLSRGVDVQIRDRVLADPSLIGKSVRLSILAAGNVDALLKGSISRKTPEANRQLNDKQVKWVDTLVEKGIARKEFNSGLFTYGASSQPETSGLAVALVGSLFMMLIVAFLAVPLGAAAAAYLEEFAPKNRWTDMIEVNINNLAAVPSIVFGLLGLAIFINMFGIPRSASLVGGLVLTLMTLPTIIIATRAAIRAVPPSIREAALGVGASKMQTLFHHTLPLALPGIMTGTIIGLVQALGETAPLLMIGLVAFVVDVPATPLDPATALPVQIYMWATSAERGFVERTAGATIVLLVFLFFMNAAAVWLRRKFERKW
ncbi:MAG: phosphate ABC transporter permease PstA [Beijerinckiaceae bacterium]